MLIGQSSLSFDDLGQFPLPSNFYNVYKDGAVLTTGFDRNLMLIPSEVFQHMLESFNSLNITDPLVRSLSRFMLGNATELDVDQDNRISIPKNLLEFAGIENEIVVIGQGEYSELWAPGFWNKQLQTLQSSEASADRFSNLFITIG